MEREFISVNVRTNKGAKIWYIDVTMLSVEKLIELKNELIGKCNVYSIDKIIQRRYCSNVYYNRNARDNKRDNDAFVRRRHRHK